MKTTEKNNTKKENKREKRYTVSFKENSLARLNNIIADIANELSLSIEQLGYKKYLNCYNGPSGNWYANGKNQIKLGKILSSLGIDEKISLKIVERWNQLYKVNDSELDNLELSSYLQPIYDTNHAKNGNISRSCMRDCGEYYSQLDSQIDYNILYLLNDDFLIGRAIIWNAELYINNEWQNIQFMDRIYSDCQHTENIFKLYARKNNLYIKKEQSYSWQEYILDPNGEEVYNNMRVPFEINTCEYMPYMDTFQFGDDMYLYSNDKEHHTYYTYIETNGWSDNHYYYCEICCSDNHTDEDLICANDGTYICPDCIESGIYMYSEYDREYYHNEQVIYSDYHYDYINIDDAIYSEYEDCYYHSDDIGDTIVYCNDCNDYRLIEDCHKLDTGDYICEDCIEDATDIQYCEKHNKYYVNTCEDCKKEEELKNIRVELIIAKKRYDRIKKELQGKRVKNSYQILKTIESYIQIYKYKYNDNSSKIYFKLSFAGVYGLITIDVKTYNSTKNICRDLAHIINNNVNNIKTMGDFFNALEKNNLGIYKDSKFYNYKDIVK